MKNMMVSLLERISKTIQSIWEDEMRILDTYYADQYTAGQEVVFG